MKYQGSIIASVCILSLLMIGLAEATWISVPPSFEPSQSTGVLTGGVLTAGAGSNEYSISDGTGIIVDPTGKKTYVSWSGQQNRVPQNLNNYLLTWISVNSTGGIVEQITKLNAEECRVRVCLGVIVHVDKINVDTTNNEQVVAYNVRSQLNDLEYALGFFNVNGNIFSANGANLKIDKSEGQIYATGSNYDININEPNIKTLPSLSGGAFQYRFSNGDNGVTGTNIDPDNLDDGAGGLDPVGQNKWSIQRIYSFISNNVKIQRGTADYGTSDQAIAEIQNELSYVTEPSIAQNGILRGWLIVKQGATALNGADAVFVEASKFGSGSGSGSGGSTGATVNDPNTDCGTDNHIKSLSLNNSTGLWTITCDADNAGGEVFTWTADHNANGNRLLNVLNASSSTGTFVFDDQKLQLYNIATSAASIQIDNDKKTAGTSQQIVMRSLDTNDNRLIYARIFNSILDATDGSEDGELRFDVVQGGTITETFTCGQIGSYYGCYIQELDRFCLDGSSCGEYINANSGVLNFVAANVARMTVYSSHVEFFSDLKLDNKNDAARSTCNGAYTGAVFFNTDDGNLNICNGTNWILPNGTAT